MSKKPEMIDNVKDVDDSLRRLHQKIDAIFNQLILFFIKNNIEIPFLLNLETPIMDQKSPLFLSPTNFSIDLLQKPVDSPKNESSYSALENKIDKLTLFLQDEIKTMKNDIKTLQEKNEKLEKELYSLKSKKSKSSETNSSSEEEDSQQPPVQLRRSFVRNVTKNVQEEVFEEIDIKKSASKSVPATPTFLPKEKLKSKEHNAEEGFYDTVFYGFPCRKNKRHEEELKELAYQGKTELLLRKLNFKGVDVNGRGMPDSICSIYNEFNDKTPLMLAAEKGHVDCVRVLISKGAYVNLLDREGHTAMDFAEQNRHKNVIELLQKHGGFKGEKYTYEFNPLHQVKGCQ